MRSESIENLISEIKVDFSNQQYQALSNDRGLNDVPDAIWKLWYSDGNHRIAYCNMDYFYIKYRNALIPEEVLVEMLIGLKDAFAHEFELINKANIEERRNSL